MHGAIEPRSADLAGPLTVVVSGLATTALALLGVFWLARNSDDFNIMGWYANYVIPAGAILVGIAASSGYGLASWFKGVKITGLLLVAVLGFQVAAYFAAQYAEFVQLALTFEDGTPVDFLSYFDWTARSFAWEQKDGSAGAPLGVWGYAFRGLEILGFSLGSLVVPIALRKHPYCEACAVYMRKSTLGWIAASIPHKKLKKRDEEAQAAQSAAQQEAFDRGKSLAADLGERARTGDSSGFRARLAENGTPETEAGKLPLRIAVKLSSCQRCSAGELVVSLWSGQGQNVKEEPLQSHTVEPHFVRELKMALVVSRS
jgi:hypothetical protein